VKVTRYKKKSETRVTVYQNIVKVQSFKFSWLFFKLKNSITNRNQRFIFFLAFDTVQNCAQFLFPPTPVPFFPETKPYMISRFLIDWNLYKRVHTLHVLFVIAVPRGETFERPAFVIFNITRRKVTECAYHKSHLKPYIKSLFIHEHTTYVIIIM